MGCGSSVPAAPPDQIERPKAANAAPPPPPPKAAAVPTPAAPPAPAPTQAGNVPTAEPPAPSPASPPAADGADDAVMAAGAARGPRRASMEPVPGSSAPAPESSTSPATPGKEGGAAPPAEEVITGVLWKRGEAGTSGANAWKQRFVVLARNSFQYYATQAAYESGKAPTKGTTVKLAEYAVMKGLAGGAPSGKSAANDKLIASSFYLQPLVKGGRVWELRSVETGDVDDWMASFVEMGCTSQAEYEKTQAAEGVKEAAAAAAAASKPDLVRGKSAAVVTQAASPAAAASEAPAAAAAAAPVAAVAATPAAAGEEAKAPAPAGDAVDVAADVAATVASAAGAHLGEDDDPATDRNDVHFKAGVLKKRGEEGTLGGGSFKPRWLVLKGGNMTYWHTEAERAKKGSKPIKENRVSLSTFMLVTEANNVIKLTPIVSGAAAELPSPRGKAATAGRVWELQVPGTQHDVNAWVSAFLAQGARRSMPKAKRDDSAKESSVENSFNWKESGDWEECVSPDGIKYYYHVPTGTSQWDEPTAPSPASTPASSAAATPVADGAAAPAPATPADGSPAADGAGATPAPPATLADTVLKVGILSRKGGVFGGASSRFFELLKDGQLTEFATEKAYAAGAAGKHNMINAHSVVIEEGKTGSNSILLKPNGKGATWELLAANAEERAAWIAALTTAGAAQAGAAAPASPTAAATPAATPAAAIATA